jgi:hypothetical protein
MGDVIVEFPERREVFCNGVSQGFNLEDGRYRASLIGDGLQRFRLGGATDFEPDPCEVEVAADSNLSTLALAALITIVAAGAAASCAITSRGWIATPALSSPASDGSRRKNVRTRPRS